MSTIDLWPVALGAAFLVARARRVSRARRADGEPVATKVAVSGGCLCGRARYTYSFSAGEEGAPEVLICHCAMCRKAIGASQGVAFAAMPRAHLTWDHDRNVHSHGNGNLSGRDDGSGGGNGRGTRSTLRAFRSSAFAQRLFCGRCGSSLMIRYDCERYTDWVTVGTVDRGARWFGGHAPFMPQTSAHIHVDGAAAWETRPVDTATGSVGVDGLPWYKGWDPWKIDVCRPKGTPAPDVCLVCFKLKADCMCNTT